MSGSHIARVAPHGYRRLGLQGQAVVAAYIQIATVLRNRAGRDHADFLAIPQIDPRTGDIDWYASRAGPIRKVSDLAEPEQSRIRGEAEQIRREIAQLADKLKREGASGELLGLTFEQALESAPGDWLYEVGGKPVQIMWGHANEAVVPVVPAAPVAAAAAATAAAPSAAAVAPLPTATPAAAAVAGAGAAAAVADSPLKPQGRWGWLLWLLPLLLLLALFLFGVRGCSPLQPGAQLSQAQQRGKALREELALLERQREAAKTSCLAVAPDAPVVVPKPPSDSGAMPPVDNGLPSINVPPSAGIAKRNPDELDTQPRTNPPDLDKQIDLPEDAMKKGSLDYLDGWWKSRNPLGEVDQSGKRVDSDHIYLQFKRGGAGELLMRRESDGSLCRSPAQARMDGPKLKIDVQPTMNCERPPPMRASNIECERMPDGTTRCNGIGYSGRPYSMEIVRSAPVGRS